MSDKKENEILKKLVVSEQDVIKDLAKMVEKASKLFSIEKPSGRILFKNFGELTDKQRIMIVLIGKYFAWKLEFIEKPSLGIAEISQETGRKAKTLGGGSNMKPLVDKGYVEYVPGRKYRVAYNRLDEIFEKVLKLKSNGDTKNG